MSLLAAQVGEMLKSRGLMLATAESCTGGGVAQAITNIPDSTATSVDYLPPASVTAAAPDAAAALSSWINNTNDLNGYSIVGCGEGRTASFA